MNPDIPNLFIGCCAFVVACWLSFELVMWLLAKKTDPNILQNKTYSSGGNLRLYDGGYSNTHEKFEAKKIDSAMSEMRDKKL